MTYGAFLHHFKLFYFLFIKLFDYVGSGYFFFLGFYYVSLLMMTKAWRKRKRKQVEEKKPDQLYS